jgi:hypothetical protein
VTEHERSETEKKIYRVMDEMMARIEDGALTREEIMQGLASFNAGMRDALRDEEEK